MSWLLKSLKRKNSDSRSSSSKALIGVRNDLAEIAGSFRTGVGKISRFASNLLRIHCENEEDEEFEAVHGVSGITDAVLNFITVISSRAENWTRFPVMLDDSDFEISDIHRIHISTVEQLVPNLSALRLNLQSCMSDEKFWMIYFIMLLLYHHEFELLSTPEILEIREILREELQNKENVQVNSEPICTNNLAEGTQEKKLPSEEEMNSTQVIRDGEGLGFYDEENSSQWLKRADTETSTDAEEETNGENASQWMKKADTEASTDAEEEIDALEEFSFTIEDDENDFFSKISVTKLPRASSPNECGGDWVQLDENFDSRLENDGDSESGESSDWFNVDKLD